MRTSESVAFYLLVRFCCELLLFLDVNVYNSSAYPRSTIICTQISFGCIGCLLLLYQLCPRGPQHVINRKHVRNEADVLLTPEDTCSLASKRFFHWLKPQFLLGWKGQLTAKNLFPLSFETSKDELLTRLNKSLHERRQKKLRRLRNNRIRTTSATTSFSSPISNEINHDDRHDLMDQSIQSDPFGHSGVKMNGKTLLSLLVGAIGPLFFFYTLIRFFVAFLEMGYTQLLEVLIRFVNTQDSYVWHGILFAFALEEIAGLRTVYRV